MNRGKNLALRARFSRHVKSCLEIAGNSSGNCNYHSRSQIKCGSVESSLFLCSGVDVCGKLYNYYGKIYELYYIHTKIIYQIFLSCKQYVTIESMWLCEEDYFKYTPNFMVPKAVPHKNYIIYAS